jgi:hypothetical protein
VPRLPLHVPSENYQENLRKPFGFRVGLLHIGKTDRLILFVLIHLQQKTPFDCTKALDSRYRLINNDHQTFAFFLSSILSSMGIGWIKMDGITGLKPYLLFAIHKLHLSL